MGNYSIWQKAKAMYRLTRFIDGVVMGVGLIIALALTGSVQRNLPILAYVLVFFGTILVTAHAMVINDIIDIDIDRINDPNRALPSGIISIKTAFIFALVLAVFGVGLYGIVDYIGYVKIRFTWLFVLFHVLLADIYNLYLKKTGIIGNVVVAYSSYSLFLLSDYFFNGQLTLLPQVVGIIAFFANLSREIFKGIIDVEGDKQHSVKTIAVKFGNEKAKYLATSIYITSLIISLIAVPFLGLIGIIGIFCFWILSLKILSKSRGADNPAIAKEIKHYILAAPLVVAPFFIIDQLYYIPISGIFQ